MWTRDYISTCTTSRSFPFICFRSCALFVISSPSRSYFLFWFAVVSSDTALDRYLIRVLTKSKREKSNLKETWTPTKTKEEGEVGIKKWILLVHSLTSPEAKRQAYGSVRYSWTYSKNPPALNVTRFFFLLLVSRFSGIFSVVLFLFDLQLSPAQTVRR